MNPVTYIKRPRELSRNDWRYRLIGYYFNGNIPNFLYTHYCPLFWMTIFCICTLPIRFIIGVLISGIIKVGDFLSRFVRKEVECKTVEEEVAEQMLWYYNLQTKHNKEALFKHFYLYNSSFCEYRHYDKQKAKELWDRVIGQIEARKQAAIEKKAAIYNRFYLIIKVTSLTFKTVVYSVAAAFFAVAGFLLGTALLHVPDLLVNLWVGLKWLFLTTEGVGVLGIIALVSIAVFSMMWFCQYHENKKKEGKFEETYLGWVVVGTFATLARWIGNVASFIAMAYEDSCPAITIKEDSNE